jgi:hypothetical protein
VSEYKTFSHRAIEMRMLGRLLSLFLTIAGIHVAEGTIKNCGNAQSPLQITSLSLSPDPPIRGQLFDLDIQFNNTGQPITNGSLVTQITFDYIPFNPITIPLCEYINCPLEIGPNSINKSTTWPDSVSGLISCNLSLQDIQSNQLLCVQIDTKVSNTNKLRQKSNFTQFDASMLADMFSYFKEPEAYDVDYDWALVN